MDLRLMFARLSSLITALLMGMLLFTPFVHAQAGEPAGAQQREWRPDPEKMHAMIKTRLEKLSARLELTASQQPAWGAFAKSVEALAERTATPPGADADAAAIARFRADMAAGFAKKLAAIADTTGKLQAVLNDNQRKLFNEEYRRIRHPGHRCVHGGEHHGAHGENGRHDDGMDEDDDAQPA